MTNSYHVFCVGKQISARLMAAFLLFRPGCRKKVLSYFNLYMSICLPWGKRDRNIMLLRYGPLRALLGQEGFIHAFNTAPRAPQTASPTLQVGSSRTGSLLPFLLLRFLILLGHSVTLRRETMLARVRTDG